MTAASNPSPSSSSNRFKTGHVVRVATFGAAASAFATPFVPASRPWTAPVILIIACCCWAVGLTETFRRGAEKEEVSLRRPVVWAFLAALTVGCVVVVALLANRSASTRVSHRVTHGPVRSAASASPPQQKSSAPRSPTGCVSTGVGERPGTLLVTAEDGCPADLGQFVTVRGRLSSATSTASSCIILGWENVLPSRNWTARYLVRLVHPSAGGLLVADHVQMGHAGDDGYFTARVYAGSADACRKLRQELGLAPGVSWDAGPLSAPLPRGLRVLLQSRTVHQA